MRYFRASLLSSSASGELWHMPDALLGISDEGRIEVLRPADPLPEAPIVDLRPCWILPGMVDLHTHLPQLDAVALDGLELLPWLKTHIFPLEARFSDLNVAKSTAARFFRQALEAGTTTLCAYSTIHEAATHAAFQEAEKCGIRAVIGKTLMDQNAPADLLENCEKALEASERLCERWHGHDHGRLHYGFTPRFAPSCSRELMKGAGRLAQKYGAFIQTHIGENPDEIDWVQTLFPECESYADVYDKYGILGPKSLLAHGIYLRAKERQQLRESGAILVHCPRSNAFLKSGIMPLRKWQNEGLNIGMGTDVAAGPSLSMFAESACACTVSKLRWAALQGEDQSEPPLLPTRAFHLATWAGAKALGFEDRIGSLEVGKDADFIVVDPQIVHKDVAQSQIKRPEDMLSRLFYREHPEMVRAAYVRGRCCMERASA